MESQYFDVEKCQVEHKIDEKKSIYPMVTYTYPIVKSKHVGTLGLDVDPKWFEIDVIRKACHILKLEIGLLNPYDQKTFFNGDNLYLKKLGKKKNQCYTVLLERSDYPVCLLKRDFTL